MRKLCILILSGLFLFSTANAFSETLSSSDISAKTLLKILDSDYAKKASIDEDGDIKIEDDGLKIYVEVDNERDFIKFSSIWRKSDSISDSRLFKILNEWNRKTVFTTVFNYEDRIYINYFICTDGGINSDNFNGTLDWLFSIASSFNEYLEDEDAI